MTKGTKATAIVATVVIVSAGLITVDLHLTYKSARRLAAEDAGRFADCVYAGTRLSYYQLYTPPRFLRLPHWEVTYDSTNPLHQFTRMVTFSEARAKANNSVVRTR